ncbi:phage holin family protein [Candidatus Microgenomates bacterium]|nr:phage holin family protein [Candidatus Microgenomates bacterium]
MIRPLIRSFAVTAISLWAAATLAGGGIVFSQGTNTFAIATLALSIANHFIKPFLNLLLLPINLISLGLFRWVTNVVLLYVVTLVVPGFKIMFFNFSGFVWQGISIPAFNVSGIIALLAVSFVISFITSFIHWLFK